MDVRNDLEKYADQWQKALADGVFADAPKPPKPVPQEDFFGQYPTLDVEETLNEVDAKYWNQVYRLSQNAGDAPDILSEDARPTETELKDFAKAVSSAANPIYPSSIGKDQDVSVTPNWTDGKELTELAELKANLEKLESKLNAEEAMGKDGKSIHSKIESLKKQIDELSDSLTPHRWGS